jgi:hypothetical protein
MNAGGFSHLDWSVMIIWEAKEEVGFRLWARCIPCSHPSDVPDFPSSKRRKTMNLLSSLYEAYCSFVEEIQKERAQRIQRRRELRRRVRPWLEGLGERIVPAAISWVGGFSSDWNQAGNWFGGVKPGATDDVTIGTLGAGCVAPVIGVHGGLNAVCASLTDLSGTSLTINAGSSLDVTGQSTATSTWGDLNNAPTLTVNGKFQLDNLGTNVGKLEWQNGNINGTGSVYLANGAQFFVELSASNLTPNLFVGEDGINNKNQSVVSIFAVSQPKVSGGAMTGNLAIGSSITIDRMGLMEFDGDTNQNAAGGIVYAAGNTTGIISVAGTVQGKADSGGQVLTVQPQVSIQFDGQWWEGTNEKMKFTFTDAQNDPSVTVFGLGGSLNLQNGANIAVTDPLLLSGGSLIVPSTAGTTTTATVQGNINDDGDIQIGDAKGLAKLNVDPFGAGTGNVDIETGGLTTYVTFNNGALTASLLNVSGQFAIDIGNNPNSFLTVTTTVNGNAPPPGTNVQLVSAGSTAFKGKNNRFFFDTPHFNGPLRYSQATLNNGYTLTV